MHTPVALPTSLDVACSRSCIETAVKAQIMVKVTLRRAHGMLGGRARVCLCVHGFAATDAL